MKILASGDLHGDTNLAERLAKRAEKENVDLVILCGDITNFESSTKNLIGPFRRVGKKVLLIPGNHESVATADFLAQVYGARNIHGYSVVYEDIGIFGAGGATNVGPSPVILEDDMFELLKKGNDNLKDIKKKIMVTHVHPKGSLIEKFSNFVPPSKAVRKAIDTFKPDILLCSHVHEAEGIEDKIGKTRVINVGKNGKIIEL
ncbi:metallophosphoesterase [Candidatus Woesearchaeota archaeon]|nr:metallophosphoesterase [Candidatus Woesearchaeota archaeon]